LTVKPSGTAPIHASQRARAVPRSLITERLSGRSYKTQRDGGSKIAVLRYVVLFAFFFLAFFARRGVVGAAAFMPVSPGATAPPGAGVLTWPGVPTRAGPPEL